MIDLKDLGEDLDNGILDGIKNKIFVHLNSKKWIDKPTIKKRMNNVLKLTVCSNLITKYKDYMLNVKVLEKTLNKEKTYDQIIMDKSFLELSGSCENVTKKVELKKHAYVMLCHELVHSASRNDNNSGIMFSEKERALNEGLTQMYTEKILNISLSPHMDAYRDFKEIAKILDVTLGEDVVAKSYFGNLKDIEYKTNQITNNNLFYKNLNQHLENLLILNTKTGLYTYKGYVKNTINQYAEYIHKSLILNLVLPHYEQLKNDDKRIYFKSLFNTIKDNESLFKKYEFYISKVTNLTKEQLQQEKNVVDTKLNNLSLYSQIIQDIGNAKLNMFEYDNTSKDIYYKSNPKILINDNLVKENIFYLYTNQQKLLNKEKYDKWDKVILETCNYTNSSWTANNIINKKNGTFESQVNMAYFKHVAKQNDFFVLNSFSNYKKETIDLEVIKIPSKGNEIVSLYDLQKILNKYYLVNKGQKQIVVDRETNEKVSEIKLVNCFLFANSWAKANCIKNIDIEMRNHKSNWFSNNNKIFYLMFSHTMMQLMHTKGTYTVKEIYEQLKQYNIPNLKEKLCALFENQKQNDIVYQFYRMQCPTTKLEIQLPKLGREAFYEDNFEKDKKGMYEM